MELYKIIAEPNEHGWEVSCPAFGITVDASDDSELDGAVTALKGLMAAAATRKLEQGDFLPADNKLDPGDISGEGSIVLYVETDFVARFIAKTSETVRRNVSMPAWMDLRLRRNNVDASRLFQDAAAAKLAEMESTGAGLRRLGSVRELEDACAPGVLDEYFRRRAESMVSGYLEKEGI